MAKVKRTVCKICNDTVDPRGAKGHLEFKHKDEIEEDWEEIKNNWTEYKDKYFDEVLVDEHEIVKASETTTVVSPEDAPERLIEFQGEKYTAQDLIFTFGYEGLHILMRKELEDALENCPAKLSSKAKKWIVDQFDRFEHYKQHPEALFTLVQGYSGVTPRVAQDIVSKVFSVPHKYRRVIELAMQTNPMLFTIPQYQSHPSFYIPTTITTPPPEYYSQPYQTPQPSTTPFQPVWPWTQPPFQPPKEKEESKYLTKEDLVKILDERDKRKEEESFFQRLMSRFERLEKDIEELKKTEEAPEVGLKNELNEIKSELRRLKEGPTEKKTSNVADAIEQIEKIIGAVDKIRGKSEVETLKESLNEIRKELGRWTGDIDDKKLKLEELRLEREIKKDEIKGWQSSAERIASAIENLSKSFGAGFGEATVGKVGSKQMIVIGDRVKAICPHCFTEYTTPLGQDVVCPVCSTPLWKRSEEVREAEASEEKATEEEKEEVKEGLDGTQQTI